MAFWAVPTWALRAETGTALQTDTRAKANISGTIDSISQRFTASWNVEFMCTIKRGNWMVSLLTAAGGPHSVIQLLPMSPD
jgi:hypothetical protein